MGNRMITERSTIRLYKVIAIVQVRNEENNLRLWQRQWKNKARLKRLGDQMDMQGESYRKRIFPMF